MTLKSRSPTPLRASTRIPLLRLARRAQFFGHLRVVTLLKITLLFLRKVPTRICSKILRNPHRPKAESGFKKFAIGAFVVVLAVLALASFLLFGKLLSDYQHYVADHDNAQKALTELHTRADAERTLTPSALLSISNRQSL
jgi:hypothetical protein